MLRPAVSEILKDGQSYYSLVIAVAKRARQIAQEAEEEHIVLTEKPVKIAVKSWLPANIRLSSRSISAIPRKNKGEDSDSTL